MLWLVLLWYWLYFWCWMWVCLWYLWCLVFGWCFLVCCSLVLLCGVGSMLVYSGWWFWVECNWCWLGCFLLFKIMCWCYLWLLRLWVMWELVCFIFWYLLFGCRCGGCGVVCCELLVRVKMLCWGLWLLCL